MIQKMNVMMDKERIKERYQHLGEEGGPEGRKQLLNSFLKLLQKS